MRRCHRVGRKLECVVVGRTDQAGIHLVVDGVVELDEDLGNLRLVRRGVGRIEEGVEERECVLDEVVDLREVQRCRWVFGCSRRLVGSCRPSLGDECSV